MDGRELADTIENEVNSGVDRRGVMEGVQKSHPALQRAMFDQVLKPAIVALAEQDYYDARNKRVVEEAKAVVDEREWYVRE